MYSACIMYNIGRLWHDVLLLPLDVQVRSFTYSSLPFPLSIFEVSSPLPLPFVLVLLLEVWVVLVGGGGGAICQAGIPAFPPALGPKRAFAAAAVGVGAGLPAPLLLSEPEPATEPVAGSWDREARSVLSDRISDWRSARAEDCDCMCFSIIYFLVVSLSQIYTSSFSSKEYEDIPEEPTLSNSPPLPSYPSSHPSTFLPPPLIPLPRFLPLPPPDSLSPDLLRYSSGPCSFLPSTRAGDARPRHISK